MNIEWKLVAFEVLEVNKKLVYYAEAQPEIFRSMGGFLEKGHLDQRFMYGMLKKDPQRSISVFFSNKLLELHFKWEFNP